jgi:cobalt/nickel transport system permease protein
MEVNPNPENIQSYTSPADTWPESSRRAPTEKFTEKTIRGLSNLTKEIIFSQEYAGRPGLLQGLDPRVKLVTIAALIVAVSLCRRAEALAALYAATLFLAAASKIPAGFFIKRVWFFIPLFSAAIAIPALFIVPGEPLIHVAQVAARQIVITRQGAESALIFVLRVAASVSFIVLLTLTTKWDSLLRALALLKVPQMFVFIIALSYRYIFFMLNFVGELYAGRRSRTLVPAGGAGGRRWVAGRIGFTLSRAMRMGDEVYEAMASRGFTGETKFINDSRPGARDLLWLLIVISAIAAVYAAGGFR